LKTCVGKVESDYPGFKFTTFGLRLAAQETRYCEVIPYIVPIEY